MNKCVACFNSKTVQFILTLRFLKKKVVQEHLTALPKFTTEAVGINLTCAINRQENEITTQFN